METFVCLYKNKLEEEIETIKALQDHRVNARYDVWTQYITENHTKYERQKQSEQ